MIATSSHVHNVILEYGLYYFKIHLYIIIVIASVSRRYIKMFRVIGLKRVSFTHTYVFFCDNIEYVYIFNIL